MKEFNEYLLIGDKVLVRPLWKLATIVNATLSNFCVEFENGKREYFSKQELLLI